MGVYTHTARGLRIALKCTPVGVLGDVARGPLACALGSGECDVLLRADDIVHDDLAPVKAQIVPQGLSRFGVFVHLAPDQRRDCAGACAQPPRSLLGVDRHTQVDHVVTFNRACPLTQRGLCQMPCAKGL